MSRPVRLKRVHESGICMVRGIMVEYTSLELHGERLQCPSDYLPVCLLDALSVCAGSVKGQTCRNGLTV